MGLRNLFWLKIWSPPIIDIYLHCEKRSIICAATTQFMTFK